MNYWKKTHGVTTEENILNNSYDDFKTTKLVENVKSGRYINPILQVTSNNLNMREKKKETSILRANVRKEY